MLFWTPLSFIVTKINIDFDRIGIFLNILISEETDVIQVWNDILGELSFYEIHLKKSKAVW